MINKNLSSILLSVLFFLVLFNSNVLYSQEPVMDSLITGKTYRITLYNDKEVIGKVVKQDSVFVYMSTETGTVRVRNEDIFSISGNTIPRLEKAIISVGGGILLNSNENYGYYTNENKPGYSIQIAGTFPFAENKAFRIDFGFSQLKVDPYVYAYSYSEYNSTYSKRNTDVYHLYGEFLFGDFNTNSTFSLYGIGGLGVIHVYESPYSYTYYDSWDSTWRTDNYRSDFRTNFSMTLGGGIRVKFNSRLGAYADVQYNIGSYSGYFLFFGGGYFPLRAGLTYSFY